MQLKQNNIKIIFSDRVDQCECDGERLLTQQYTCHMFHVICSFTCHIGPLNGPVSVLESIPRHHSTRLTKLAREFSEG